MDAEMHVYIQVMCPSFILLYPKLKHADKGSVTYETSNTRTVKISHSEDRAL